MTSGNCIHTTMMIHQLLPLSSWRTQPITILVPIMIQVREAHQRKP